MEFRVRIYDIIRRFHEVEGGRTFLQSKALNISDQFAFGACNVFCTETSGIHRNKCQKPVNI